MFEEISWKRVIYAGVEVCDESFGALKNRAVRNDRQVDIARGDSGFKLLYLESQILNVES